MAAIDRMLCQAAEHFLYIGTEEIFMSVSYKKLWKLLIDKDMKKKDLCEKAGISPASVLLREQQKLLAIIHADRKSVV